MLFFKEDPCLLSRKFYRKLFCLVKWGILDLVIPLTCLIKRYTHSTSKWNYKLSKNLNTRDTFSTKPGYNLSFNNKKGSQNPAVSRGYICNINYMGEAQKCSESDKKVLVIKRTDLKSQGQVLSFY